MNAIDVTAAALEAVPDALVVASLGTATSALRAASGDGPHLYLGGSMGAALSVAIGVAERRPDRRVLCLAGDGETLMGSGTLWSLAGIRPANLLLVVLADGHYSITGGQPLGAPAAVAAVASALGLASAVATSPESIREAAATLAWPAVVEARYDDRTWPGPSPFVDPPVVRHRFEEAAGA